MSSKMADAKTLLKDARKHIAENEFKEAQECCKVILRNDKENYLALVMLGKALQYTDQAQLAFQKAIACQKDHPLAWHGLSSYYEKCADTDSKIKLLSVYEEMINLDIEHGKLVEIYTKLGQLGSSLKNPQAMSILINVLMTKQDCPRNIIEEQIVKLLKSDVPHKDNELLTLLEILHGIHAKTHNDASLELIMVKLTTFKQDKGLAVQEIINFPFFAQNIIVKQWFCSYLFKMYVRNDSFCGLNIENLFTKVTDGIEDYKYVTLLKSAILYDKHIFLEAYKKCIPLVDYNQPEMPESIFAIKCTVMLQKWSLAQKLACNFLIKVNDEIFISELRKYLFVSLAKQQKWSEALSIIKKGVNIDSFSSNELACLTECYIICKEPFEDILEKLSGTDYFILLQAFMFINNEKYDEVICLLQSNSSELPLKYYYLGIAYWELQKYDKCQINFLKAAKLDPNHANTFLYLGYFYEICAKDLEKAKKCYEKANDINPIDSGIAKKLSEIYATLGYKDLDYDLLISLENTELKNDSWLNFRLGLHFLNKRNWEYALLKFRNVIKSDPTNKVAFECLADAYYSRGSYTSALRAYNKVMSLNPTQTLHCLTRIGYIYTLLTQHKEAISTFGQVLEADPSSILALKGIAHTWIKIAKKKHQFKLYGSARDCAQNAVDYIIKALKIKQYSCILKMLGDTLVFLTKLPNKYAHVDIETFFNGDTNNRQRLQNLDILSYAAACYSHIMKLSNQPSFDLALTYLNIYRKSNTQVHCQISFNLTLACVKKRPIWRNWNLLGKLCLAIKKYNLAQHCFIKALLATRKWSVAEIWCNLGTLYLKLKLYKLANYCYWRGQSTLPSYPQSWIGQGIIAENVREEEAMDLFRHASWLGYHRESALGYADWVYRTLKLKNIKDPHYNYVIHGLYAVPYAIDLMHWLCSFEENNACAYNVLGILQETFGLIHPAKQSFERALIYVDETKKNITLLNMARILLRLQQYDDAIKHFKAISEASLDSACGLALALFKKGLYEEAYSTYDTALHWLSDHDNEKSEVLVAMAGIVYMFKGPDEAKTLLFQSIQLSQKKPTPYSLFAVCSIGLLHSDDNLSKLAISELQKYEKDSTYSFDIGFLKSYLFVCDKKLDEAIASISDSIHDHPNITLLWFCMAQYCLSASRSRARAASACAQRALCSAHAHFNQENNPAKMLATASIAEYEAGNHNRGLLLAKKGLHMYPNDCEMWAALIFSLSSQKFVANKREWLSVVIRRVRRDMDNSRKLSRWFSIVDKRLHTKF